MTTEEIFDLIVIGSGSAAGPVVSRTVRAGWSVAVVDEGPFGGTCAQTGCVPKRVWAHVAEVVDAARRQRARGVDGQLEIAWPSLQRFTATFTEDVPQDTKARWREDGVEVIRARARFAGQDIIAAGDRRLRGRYIHLAAGARPRPLDIPGAELVTTTDDLFRAAELAPRIVFIGGGYVSFELACVLAIAGADVTILDANDRLLERFEPELASLLVKRVQLFGIDVRQGATTTAVERAAGDGLLVRTTADGGAAHVADMVVHGAGRVAATDGLDPARGGVRADDDGVVVNPHMRSVTNPHVYAAGDIVSGSEALTPVATREADIVAANMVLGEDKSRVVRPAPSVLFSIPPLARVGLLEEDARANQLDVRVNRGRMDDWLSSRMRGISPTAYKIIIDERSDRVIGAHVLGPDAEQQANLFALAMQRGIPADELAQALFVFPTGGSDLRSMLG